MRNWKLEQRTPSGHWWSMTWHYFRTRENAEEYLKHHREKMLRRSDITALRIRKASRQEMKS